MNLGTGVYQKDINQKKMYARRRQDKYLFLASFRCSFLAVDISDSLIIKAQNCSVSTQQMHKSMKKWRSGSLTQLFFPALCHFILLSFCDLCSHPCSHYSENNLSIQTKKAFIQIHHSTASLISFCHFI